jgi:alpha/beta superfamily hydrolase
MVTRGQFLERSTLIPVGEFVLEGLSHRGDARPPLLILPPPPGDGGMDHVVAAELAWAAASAGHPTLRFNYRGVGASQGKRGDAAQLLEDAEAALRLLQENADVQVCAAVAIGGSAPVLRSLAARHSGLQALAFITPSDLAPEDFALLRAPLLVVVGARDLRQPRAALAAAVTEAGGQFELVEDADGAFLRNLPQVGRAAAQWLQAQRT